MNQKIRYDERVAFSKDSLFDILRNSRRREVLRCLLEGPRTAKIGDLAERIARREFDGAEVTSKQRKRVYVALYQSHLPRMRDAGFVTYDEGKVVRLRDGAAALAPFLERMIEPGPVAPDDIEGSLPTDDTPTPVRRLPPEIPRTLRERGIAEADDAELSRAVIALAADRPGELADHLLRMRDDS